jgi:hypothetical protein
MRNHSTPNGCDTLPFKLSESVVVKSGVDDPNFGDDMSGKQGRVTEMEEYPSGHRKMDQ